MTARVAIADDRETTNMAPAWYRKLWLQVLIALGCGVLVGLASPGLAVQMKVLGDAFLSLIKTGVAPLAFLTIVHAIGSAGDVKRASRIGWRSIVYFEVISTVALGTGLLAGNLLKIGAGVSTISVAPAAASAKAPVPLTQDLAALVRHLVPDSFIGAFVGTEPFHLMILAVLVGCGILGMPPSQRDRVNAGVASLSEVIFSFLSIVMKFAPIGAFGAVAHSVGSNGPAMIATLLKLVLCFYAVVALFIAGVLGLVARFAGFSLRRLLGFIKEEIFLVLGTASSESALAPLLEKLHRFGCKRQTVELVLPVGYALNLDGTAIFMSMGILFIGHVYQVPLTLSNQLGILLLMLLTSKGAATVTGGSYVVFAWTVTLTGIVPVEGLALVLGVYRLLSVAIAACNVVGNSVATVVVAKWSGTFDADAAEHRRPCISVQPDLSAARPVAQRTLASYK